MPLLEDIGIGKLQLGIICDFLRVNIWLFQVGPHLEAGEKTTDAVRY